MGAKHRAIGPPVHEAEAAGIRALVQALPSSCFVYTNVELATGRAGQTFEHDAVVVAPHAVFTVELKSWGGRIQGNRDRWTLADGALRQSPIPTIQAKARVLKGRLRARDWELDRVWVQGLVFLTAADADPRISPDYEELVVTRRDVGQAIMDPAWLRHPPALHRRQIQHVLSVLEDGSPRRSDDRAGDYKRLSQLAAEDRPYDLWLAENTVDGARRVLHVYRADGQDQGTRDRRRNLALREATLHNRVLGAPCVLRYFGCQTTREDPERILLVFEDTTPFSPLSSWVQEHRPSVEARLRLAREVARGLAWVHDKDLVHRRLSPECILASGPEPEQVRITGFELARDLRGSAPTLAGSALKRLDTLYAAPELLRRKEAKAAADLFSLGVVLFELLAGRRLFTSVDQLLRPFELPALEVHASVSTLVSELLRPEPELRLASAAELVQRLDACLARYEVAPEAELAEGHTVADQYVLEGRLGRGATSETWLARDTQTDDRRVLKIAEGRHAALLRRESHVLGQVSHERVVRSYDLRTGEPTLLVLEWVDGVTATMWAAAGDPLGPAAFLDVARDLLGALRAVHEAGWLHRDVKPDNVMLVEPGPRATLLDLGLARPLGDEDELAVGTVRYKDPLVYAEGRWTPASDQYALCLVLYEILTGLHPFGSATPDSGNPPVLDPGAFPESWPEPQAQAVATLLAGALALDRQERPSSLGAPQEALEAALEERQEPLVVPPRPAVLSELEGDASVERLAVPVRVHGALSRLGIERVDQLGHIDLEAAKRLSNVGAKTLRLLGELVEEARVRFGGVEPPPVAPVEPFFPTLLGDDRPLSELGRALTRGIREGLHERGIYTVGELAEVPAATLLGIPSMGPSKVERLRAALSRMVEGAPCPERLSGYEAALVREVGEASRAALAVVIGLDDGEARSQGGAAERLGVSRQRVAQAVELAPLRRAGSVGSCLCRTLSEFAPPPGFARVDTLAESVATLLEAEAGAARGWTRLGALLLDADARASHAVGREIVAVAPWTVAAVEGLVSEVERLAGQRTWPAESLATTLWDGLDGEVQRLLVRRGAGSEALLAAVLELADARRTADSVHVSPVTLEVALPLAREELPPRGGLVELRAALEEAVGPLVDGSLEDALLAAGWQREGSAWLDPRRVETAHEAAEVQLDGDVPRQAVANDVPPVVRDLAASRERGGVRVVALEPAVHHRLSRQLADWLVDAVGAEHVAVVHVDRVLVEALRAAGFWPLVTPTEGQEEPDWSWARRELEQALDEAMVDARRGRVTVLAEPSLLGPLGLMPWLSGFYERARGGRHGLVVLAMPGGVYDNRVRLNQTWNLPYTPDMAAVYLEEGAR